MEILNFAQYVAREIFHGFRIIFLSQAKALVILLKYGKCAEAERNNAINLLKSSQLFHVSQQLRGQ